MGCCAPAQQSTACPHPPIHPPTSVQVLNGTLFAASTGRIDDRWRSFMQFQIARARQVSAAGLEGLLAGCRSAAADVPASADRWVLS